MVAMPLVHDLAKGLIMRPGLVFNLYLFPWPSALEGRQSTTSVLGETTADENVERPSVLYSTQIPQLAVEVTLSVW